MKTRTILAAVAWLIVPLGAAVADDHLHEAKQHGLAENGTAATHTHAFTMNSAGHSGDLAPGQGSPFTGHDTQTPATDTEAANQHAHINQRGADSSEK